MPGWDAEYSIINATISAADLSTEDFGMLVPYVSFDYGGAGQGLSARGLYSPRSPANDVAGFFIWRMLEVAGVSKWSKLVGCPVRVDQCHTDIRAIGHFLNDVWFKPDQEFKALLEARGIG